MFELVNASSSQIRYSRVRHSKGPQGESNEQYCHSRHYMKANISSTADLSDCRQRLLARRGELRQQLSSLTVEQRRIADPLSADSEEQATQRENDEVIDALHEGGRAELRSVEQAIERLDAGTYGKCTRCGGLIEAQRLQAVPYASACSHCATTAAEKPS